MKDFGRSSSHVGLSPRRPLSGPRWGPRLSGAGVSSGVAQCGGDGSNSGACCQGGIGQTQLPASRENVSVFLRLLCLICSALNTVIVPHLPPFPHCARPWHPEGTPTKWHRVPSVSSALRRQLVLGRGSAGSAVRDELVRGFGGLRYFLCASVS